MGWATRQGWPRARLTAAAGIVALWGQAAACAAERQEDPPPRLHLFSGSDAASRSTFAHGGLIWAPTGDLHTSGWRLRAVADAGLYRYDAGDREITGRMATAEVLPGYQWLRSSFGLSMHLGVAAEHQTTRPLDRGKAGQGTRLGARAYSEAWVRVSERVIVNASAGYATARRNYTARLTVTLELSDRLLVEPELAVFGEPGYRQTRVGVFAGWGWRPDRRLMVGGGWSFDPDRDGPYAGVQFKAWR